jgi:hypothetical protein
VLFPLYQKTLTKNTTMAGTEPACSAAEKTATDPSGIDADKNQIKYDVGIK